MKRALLVDDNETNRDLLSRQLTRKGWEVVLAVDGPQALRIAREAHPEIILMDLALPGMGGLEAVRILKAQKQTASIPILVLTAHAMPSDQVRSIDAGSDGFETKPVDFARLLTKMDDLVEEFQKKALRNVAEECDV